VKEFDLIARIRQRAATRGDVVLGIGDDGAVLRVPPGHDLVVVSDTLNTGVHFPVTTAPFDIGWKALAVNLSDLAAMGATPAWCTLALSLPEASEAWLDPFLDGFLGLAAQHGCALVGGDTTRGPLSLCVTAHGLLPHGTALLRSGARPGDDLWVTGTLGDAAAALSQWSRHSREGGNPGATTPRHSRESGNPAPSATLRHRLDRPTPRVQTGIALRGLATACIDISDGLTADLGHILAASNVGATLDLDTLPTSPALRDAFAPRDYRAFQLTGGDDYELCFTAPPSARAAIASFNLDATRIGHIDATPGLRLHDAHGDTPADTTEGWDHFR
jgi:thiamine-monophosphate kinase